MPEGNAQVVLGWTRAAYATRTRDKGPLNPAPLTRAPAALASPAVLMMMMPVFRMRGGRSPKKDLKKEHERGGNINSIGL